VFLNVDGSRGSTAGRFVDAQGRELANSFGRFRPLNSYGELQTYVQFVCKSPWPSNGGAGKYGIGEV
jgi:hypothetical protein